jgi:hypothetical protein
MATKITVNKNGSLRIEGDIEIYDALTVANMISPVGR